MWKHKNFINLQLYAGETWVLNETISITDSETFNTNFTTVGTDNTNWTAIFVNRKGYIEYGVDGGAYEVYGGMVSAGWHDEAYRTITFAASPTGDLLTWLQANGTKQSTSSLTFKHFYDSGTIGTGTYKFRHYSQQEPSSGETWVLNESGLEAFGTSSKQFAVDFTFDRVRYTGIKFEFKSPFASYLYWTGESSLLVYNYGDVAWAVTSRTIIFDEPVTDTTLLTWLQANGTKQSAGN